MNLNYRIEALVFDYDKGKFTMQTVSEPFTSIRIAKQVSSLLSRDFGSTRVRSCR